MQLGFSSWKRKSWGHKEDSRKPWVAWPSEVTANSLNLTQLGSQQDMGSLTWAALLWGSCFLCNLISICCEMGLLQCFFVSVPHLGHLWSTRGLVSKEGSRGFLWITEKLPHGRMGKRWVGSEMMSLLKSLKGMVKVLSWHKQWPWEGAERHWGREVSTSIISETSFFAISFISGSTYQCARWLWWIFQECGQILSYREAAGFNGKPEGAAFPAINATWGLKTPGVNLEGCQPKHPIVSEKMCLSLKNGRAVLPLSPGDIPPFPSPLPSHHHPAKFLQKQTLLVTPTALSALELFVLIPILIVTINPRGLGRAVFKPKQCQLHLSSAESFMSIHQRQHKERDFRRSDVEKPWKAYISLEYSELYSPPYSAPPLNCPVPWQPAHGTLH